MQKAPPTEPTIEEIEEISQLIAQATDSGEQAATFSAIRMRQCVMIGDRLKEFKIKVGHGKWESFAEDKWPGLTKNTRTRWMRLAEVNAKGLLDLESARGLRHAYMLAGLLPDPGDGPNLKGAQTKGNYLVHIARLVAALQHVDIESMSAPDKNTLRERLAPVVALHGRLAA